MYSDKNDKFRPKFPLFDPLSSVGWPPNDCTKNSFILFFLENVVQKSGYSLIVPGTLVKMTFLTLFFEGINNVGNQLPTLVEICGKVE